MDFAFCIGGPLDGYRRSVEGERISVPVYQPIDGPVSFARHPPLVAETKFEVVHYDLWFHRWMNSSRAPSDKTVYVYKTAEITDAVIWQRLFEIEAGLRS